ncbi:hypothetical protein F8S13_25230 [Chloroflexia bacterium SDU3-3]|nr:hypothetical protein F8S13_25230 [Chloroflexia bacterium SDU3-3]
MKNRVSNNKIWFMALFCMTICVLVWLMFMFALNFNGVGFAFSGDKLGLSLLEITLVMTMLGLGVIGIVYLIALCCSIVISDDGVYQNRFKKIFIDWKDVKEIREDGNYLYIYGNNDKVLLPLVYFKDERELMVFIFKRMGDKKHGDEGVFLGRE